MSNDFHPPVRRFILWFAVALAIAACSTAPKDGGAAAPAHVSVVNLTDYRWRIEITATGGARHFTEWLEPRRSAELAVPGGGYQIEQSIEDATDRPPATRHFIAELAAGKTYHWPLATLQSDGADDAAGPAAGG